MAEKLRLTTKGNRFRVRMHTAVLAVIVVVSILVGFAAAKGFPSISGMFVKENCIPQKDFQYFLDKFNTLQADYQGCVSDAWTLQLACKMSSAQAKSVISNLSTNSTK